MGEEYGCVNDSQVDGPQGFEIALHRMTHEDGVRANEGEETSLVGASGRGGGQENGDGGEVSRRMKVRIMMRVRVRVRLRMGMGRKRGWECGWDGGEGGSDSGRVDRHHPHGAFEIECCIAAHRDCAHKNREEGGEGGRWGEGSNGKNRWEHGSNCSRQVDNSGDLAVVFN